MISDNKKGNPNHDENGRFTSNGNAKDKLADMGFGPSKNEQLRAELEKGDYVNIDNGLSLDDFDMVDYGPEYSGYEDLAIDARKNSDGEYEVYLYREDENGPLEGEYPEDNDPTYVFNSFEELQAFIDSGYKGKEKETKPQDRVEKWHSTPEYIKKRNKLITQLNRGEINMNQYYESLKILDDLFVKRNPPQNAEEAREDFLRASDNWEHHGGSWVEVERTYDEWKKALKKEGKEPFYKD